MSSPPLAMAIGSQPFPDDATIVLSSPLLSFYSLSPLWMAMIPFLILSTALSFPSPLAIHSLTNLPLTHHTLLIPKLNHLEHHCEGQWLKPPSSTAFLPLHHIELSLSLGSPLQRRSFSYVPFY
ncbi:hypothetical protein VNO77_07906 [Canavalia gladiata]|uniref:Uncharacterized protein n=1 Tax=Canavalia gladiata TaxID=3824 RepID=A0AAN9M8Y5_CANGL